MIRFYGYPSMNRSRAVFVFIAMSPLFVSGTRLEERPSIVLVSVGTLRADHLGAYGGGATSPYLDLLAARGLVFDRAFVPFPQTSASRASMLTSVNPWTLGVVTNGLSIGPNVDTLAAALKRASCALPRLAQRPGLVPPDTCREN